MRVSGTRAGRAALGAAAAGGVRHLAHRFIVGETPQAALPTFRHLWDDGVASSVDLLGEATVTEPEADRYATALPGCADGARRRDAPMAIASVARGRRLGRPAARERVREDLGADAAAAP